LTANRAAKAGKTTGATCWAKTSNVLGDDRRWCEKLADCSVGPTLNGKKGIATESCVGLQTSVFPGAYKEADFDANGLLGEWWTNARTVGGPGPKVGAYIRICLPNTAITALKADKATVESTSYDVFKQVVEADEGGTKTAKEITQYLAYYGITDATAKGHKLKIGKSENWPKSAAKLAMSGLAVLATAMTLY